MWLMSVSKFRLARARIVIEDIFPNCQRLATMFPFCVVALACDNTRSNTTSLLYVITFAGHCIEIVEAFCSNLFLNFNDNSKITFKKSTFCENDIIGVFDKGWFVQAFRCMNRTQ